MARRLGWEQSVLDSLSRRDPLAAAGGGAETPPGGGELEPSVECALRFAEAMTLASERLDDALFLQLRAHFDEGQVIELAAVIGLFNYFNRFNNALDMAPTLPGER